MKQSLKKKMSVLLAAVTAVSLVGCSAEDAESSFENPLPWHDDVAVAPNGSYEQLNYSVAVYDTSKGVSEAKRVKIADGAMQFVLDEGTDGYTTLGMEFTLTYNDEEGAGDDKGLTDTITSLVEFGTNSLAVKSSQKTVTLADREGQANLSYSVSADYFGTHKATYIETKTENAKERTLSLPTNSCRDNEMMFFLARAQNIGKSSSTNFKMVNLFDSFKSGSLTEYTMLVSGSDALRTVDLGDWVKDFGVEAVTDEETEETTYPISCYYTSIAINDENSGPPYIVYYSENPFKQGDGDDAKSHAKIPVIISYSLYNGSNPYRYTEYTLTSCTFDKE